MTHTYARFGQSEVFTLECVRTSLDTYHNSMRRAHQAKVRVQKYVFCIRVADVLLTFDAGLGFMPAPCGCGNYLGRSIIKQISKRIQK